VTTLDIVLVSFCNELGKLGFNCYIDRNEDFADGFSLVIQYKPGQLYHLYYEEPQMLITLHHPDDHVEDLPVELSDPKCYEHLAQHIRRTHRKHKRPTFEW
jgi:hypothetical protein